MRGMWTLKQTKGEGETRETDSEGHVDAETDKGRGRDPRDGQ